jgi:hypothetical protein
MEAIHGHQDLIQWVTVAVNITKEAGSHRLLLDHCVRPDKSSAQLDGVGFSA